MLATTKPTVAFQRRAAAAVPAFGRSRVVVKADQNRQTTFQDEKERKDVTDMLSEVESPKDVAAAVRTAQGQLERDPSAFRAPIWVAVFSRRREAFAGRLAMLGFTAAAAWEILTPEHLGVLGATQAITGLSLPAVKAIYALIVLHGLTGLIYGTPTFSEENQEDLQKRPNTATSQAWFEKNPFTKGFSETTGTSPSWGYTKKNEVFAGRMAMLGFLAAVGNEIPSGGLGAVGQVAWWFGVNNPSNEFYRNAGLLILAWGVLTTTVGFLSGRGGTVKGENDIY